MTTYATKEFRETSIPWLPRVPEGWEEKKVRQLFRQRTTKVSEKNFAALSVTKDGIVPRN